MAELHEESYKQGFVDGVKSKVTEELTDVIGALVKGMHEAIVKSSEYIIESVSVEKIDVQPVNRWISVEVKLPEDNSMVLCYCRTTTGEGDLYMLGSYQKDSWFLKTSRIHSTFPNPQMQVLYWRPLPEPPKEEG